MRWRRVWGSGRGTVNDGRLAKRVERPPLGGSEEGVSEGRRGSRGRREGPELDVDVERVFIRAMTGHRRRRAALELEQQATERESLPDRELLLRCAVEDEGRHGTMWDGDACEDLRKRATDDGVTDY